MTYKELYLKEHPDEADNFSEVVELDCPGDHFNNEEAPHPVEQTCLRWPQCKECWDQEIPKETEGFKSEDLVPVGEEIAKGIEEGITEPKTSVNFDGAEFQKKVYDALGVPQPSEEIKQLYEAWKMANVYPIEPKPIEVKPEVDIGGMKVESTDHGTVIKDSGTRREFATGAVRDIQEGKGRCDLMPLDVIADWFEQPKKDPYPERTEMTYWVFTNIYCFQECGETEFLHCALSSFLYTYDYVPTMFLEVAKHFEAGAAKYGEWNWQKGIPTHCYIDSAVRHYLKFLRGDKDEPHDRAFVWNILCCIWTCKHKPELNDYPRKEEKDV